MPHVAVSAGGVSFPESLLESSDLAFPRPDKAGTKVIEWP